MYTRVTIPHASCTGRSSKLPNTSIPYVVSVEIETRVLEELRCELKNAEDRGMAQILETYCCVPVVCLCCPQSCMTGVRSLGAKAEPSAFVIVGTPGKQ